MRNPVENDHHGLTQVLRANLASLTAHPLRPDELQVERDADPVDQIRAGTERDVAAERITLESATVHEIEDALTRLSSGGYGVCEECGVPIAAARLQAVPWARRCLPCQVRTEKQPA